MVFHASQNQISNYREHKLAIHVADPKQEKEKRMLKDTDEQHKTDDKKNGSRMHNQVKKTNKITIPLPVLSIPEVF